MATQVLIYGFIECCVGQDAHNIEVLSNFPFDAVYPFSNIFSPPKPGYHASVIAFAGAFKNLESDLEHWISRFELLICNCKAVSATIRAQSDEFGEVASIDYVCPEAKHGGHADAGIPLLWHRYTMTSVEGRFEVVEEILRPALRTMVP